MAITKRRRLRAVRLLGAVCGAVMMFTGAAFAEESVAVPEAGVKETNEAYEFTIDTDSDGVGASAGISSGGWASLGSELSYMEFPESAASDDGEKGMWCYCIDITTDTQDGHKYSMTTLDAAEYYDEEAAAKIRSILTESYPNKSIAELAENYGLEGLTDEEAYMATQWVLWYYSNPDGLVDAGGGSYYPADIYKPSEYPSETVTMWYEDNAGTERVSRSANVVKLAKLLDALEPAESYETEPAEIVFNKTELEDRVIFDYGESKGVETLENILITVKDAQDNNIPFVENGTAIAIRYDDLTASEGVAKIKLCFEAIQTLARDAYFFSPEGGRDASQSRVAVYGGTVPYTESEEFELLLPEKEDPGENPEEDPGEDPGENPEEAPGNDDAPKTGDQTQAVPFALMIMSALAGITVNLRKYGKY